MSNILRQSPIHDALHELKPHWEAIGDMAVASHFGDPAEERERMRSLALCDVSALHRAGLKGRGAEAWLETLGVRVSAGIYNHGDLEGGGLIVRTGGSEFFLEDGLRGGLAAKLLADRLPVPTDVHRFWRQDAGMLLSGAKVFEVLAQTCGYNFRKPDGPFVMSRVAGVSCSILRRDRHGVPTFHLWCDGSYGMYLWEQLAEIVRETGGGVVGTSCFFEG